MSCCRISCCRICKNPNLIQVIDLGSHCLCGRFPSKDEIVPQYPLVLVLCDTSGCGLLQLAHTVSCDELYNHGYGYRSGINNTMIEHLQSISKEAENYFNIESTDILLDIGSNDGTLLKSYKSVARKIGIDPTGAEFVKYYTEDLRLICDYFTAANFSRYYPEQKAKIITSISMFYDLEDPVEFMRDIKNILADDGIWITEQSYMPTMLEKLSFDTICHEHLEYYAFKQIKWMAAKVGLKIINVELNTINGGSFRITFTHLSSSLQPNIESIISIENGETLLGLNKSSTYTNFMSKCDFLKNSLMSFLQEQKSMGKRISIYGASTKGNTLLQYFGIDSRLIDSVAEKNGDKFGKYTPGTLIPILSEKEVRSTKPHFMLVLPWHFKDEFIIRENEYLLGGGQLIFPLPAIDIISGYKKVLITGINGQIGRYLTNALLEGGKCHIYGLLHTNRKNCLDQVFYLSGDILSPGSIENIISLVNPEEIYNLVGESDSRTSHANPLRAMELNHGVVIRICESMRVSAKQVKLFNASSAEIYKGLQKSIIHHKEPSTYPLNPYAISKLAAYWTIRHYRDTYGLHCSSGIIFTTESPLRRNTFLIKKVTEKIVDIKYGLNVELSIGSLNNQRDWIHAQDVATAIVKIVQQSSPDDYIISMAKLNSVKELIELSFKSVNMGLEWKKIDGILFGLDAISQQIYVRTSPDSVETEMILGDNSKLLSIGWVPCFNFKSLIQDLISSEINARHKTCFTVPMSQDGC